jgi:hypothetical protein
VCDGCVASVTALDQGGCTDGSERPGCLHGAGRAQRRIDRPQAGSDLEEVRAILLRVIDREQATVDAGLKDQGVEFGGTITVSADGEVTLPDDIK